MQLGALCQQNVTAETLSTLKTYAAAIGLAFQVQDDILDVVGDTETLGKPQGSDQALDKSTYPALLGLDAARELARWWQQQASCVQVLHPALPESPGYAHWQALCENGYGGAAGLFSVILDARFTRDQCDAFCDALKLFKLGYSWGGPISLVVPYDLKEMRQSWPAHLARGTIVRFSIGLEDVQDLQDDIAQALRVLRA